MADSPGYQSDSTAVDKPAPRTSRGRPARSHHARGTSSARDHRSLVQLAGKLVERIIHSIIYAPFAWATWLLYRAYQEVIRLVFASSELPLLPVLLPSFAFDAVLSPERDS